MSRRNLICLIMILIIAAILRFYRLDTFLLWSDDVGRDILVAKTIIAEGQLPLLGPPTSLNWLRLGPLVYYIWAPALYLGGLNPLSVAVVTALFDISAIILVYILSREIFGKKAAFYASMLYTFSPFAVLHSRTPLHANLVPFFSVLFYIFIWRFIKSKKTNYFYFCCFLLGILIQLHITPVILAGILFIYIYKKIKIREVVWGATFFCLPLFPFIIADYQHQFFITSRFLAWLPYRILSAFGIFTQKNILTADRIGNVLSTTAMVLQKMIFIASKEIATLIFISSFILLLLSSIKKIPTPIQKMVGIRLTMLILVFSYLFIFLQGQPAEHYFSFLMPIVIVNIAYLLSTDRLGWLVMLILVASNCYSLLSSNY